MKEIKKYSFLIFICAMMGGMWGCNRSGDDPPPILPTASLNVINAVTDIRAINFYLNGTRQNNNSAIFLYNASGYLSVTKGEQQYQFKSDTDRTVLADIKLNMPLTDSTTYTLVLTGQQRKNNLTPIFIADNFIVDTNANNARVRFVQASTGVQAYDVFVGDTLSFKNQPFKNSTAFVSVGPGKKTVKVNLAGTNTPVFSGTVILNQNTYYTLYTSGEQGGTGKNALNVAVNISR
ncbi:DUF4397 domain-containing protein [Mucilaginibacter myungsuensis]|uniref:DUF4397 domain-containing protein n=1 Tax=Mucilaginibacter myungsuensis TaxID=649104 RepID=A0A929L0V3_9SPHI|nr:DUF4397 domain-containing protein [Mucilaginibacter myungsuensis]MBE9664180.1 DUF4397 domain-containing protein [Mucilaginibacter myungsuensis]MDN3599883.1 DUF4397 domain-containing protein [Mucilaginibacter myungsuensis]